MPKVSVIVATYRRDDLLQRALESVTEQTYKDFEVILVDDNDDLVWNRKVQQIVETYRGKYPMIELKYIANHPNQGSARTRNTGIAAAGGAYVCFLDDDDTYEPERIQNQLEPMERVKADYSITNLALYSESGMLIETRKREYILDTSAEQLLKYHLMHHMTGTDAMMFRREYLLQIGCFSPIDVGDEFYLMLKAILCGGSFLHVPVCDIKAYVHTGEGGLSSGQSKIDGENSLFEYKKRYFEKLKRSEVNYIKMRHFLVLAYAHLRMKKYGAFFVNGAKGFVLSPIEALHILFNK